MTREALLHLAHQMPDTFSFEDLVRELVFVEGILIAERELDEGKGIPHEQMIAKFAALKTKLND